MKSYLIGMDLGTTNIKAALFDEDGNTIASASSSAYTLLHPGPNMVEQDPQMWWSAASDILREITAKAGSEITAAVKGISVSSQLPTLLPVDEAGTPLQNAIIWMDSRAAGELDEILNAIGYEEYIASAGAQPDAAFLPCKIRWLRKNKPELFAKTHKILQANGYINLRLTGEMTMDIDTAGLCQCYDLRTNAWSKTIGAAVGADFDAIMPKLYKNNEIIGSVTKAAAEETGLAIGTPVVCGTGDCFASMYATGLSKLGEAGESSGTTSLLFVGSGAPSATDIPVVARPCSIKNMPYLFNAPINTSGAAVKWYLDTLGGDERAYAKANNINVYDHLNAVALQSPPGSNGLIFFPYMAGERAPLWNSYARGMFIGLSMETKREHIVRAVFEGTAFAVRHVLDMIKQTGTKIDCLRISGGGAKSRTWSMIKASMLNVPVHILEDGTGDATFGNALIAGHAVGVFPDLSESMKKFVKVKEVIEPIPEWVEVYDKLYPFYIDMCSHLDGDLFKLKSVMDEINK